MNCKASSIKSKTLDIICIYPVFVAYSEHKRTLAVYLAYC